MLIRLNEASGQPLYLQIVEQVKHMVAAGTLRADDRLPTVRELATELIVNPNTIAHAYQQLERESVIETRRGLGSFICKSSSSLSSEAKLKLVSEILDRALVEAHHLGLETDEVKDLLNKRIAAMYGKGSISNR
jgi:GntR family transcriptional regulator